MSQVQDQNKSQSTINQAELVLNQFGQRIGFFTGLATHNIQKVATSLGEEAKRQSGRVNQQNTVQPESSANQTSGRQAQVESQEANKQAVQKAEKVVDNMGQRMTNWVFLASLQFQRATVRVREEAEDMWAEAQYIRQQNSPLPH
jgi:hypothetical protein